MNITFKHLRTPEDLRNHYWLIEEACANFTKHKLPTFAPDVYGVLQRGQAEIVIGHDEGVAKGFFTFYTSCAPLEQPALHVWHGYIQPNIHPEYLKAAFDDISRVAKENGCSKIMFSTVRRGWIRVIKKHNFELQSYTYARNV